MTKSLLDYAFDCISQSKEPVNFKDLWAYVVKESGIDEELAARKISSFYTNLMLDGRFVTLGAIPTAIILVAIAVSRHSFSV